MAVLKLAATAERRAMDRGAIITGAMRVAPLMTPIFGMSLARAVRRPASSHGLDRRDRLGFLLPGLEVTIGCVREKRGEHPTVHEDLAEALQ